MALIEKPQYIEHLHSQFNTRLITNTVHNILIKANIINLYGVIFKFENVES